MVGGCPDITSYAVTASSTEISHNVITPNASEPTNHFRADSSSHVKTTSTPDTIHRAVTPQYGALMETGSTAGTRDIELQHNQGNQQMSVLASPCEDQRSEVVQRSKQKDNLSQFGLVKSSIEQLLFNSLDIQTTEAGTSFCRTSPNIVAMATSTQTHCVGLTTRPAALTDHIASSASDELNSSVFVSDNSATTNNQPSDLISDSGKRKSCDSNESDSDSELLPTITIRKRRPLLGSPRRKLIESTNDDTSDNATCDSSEPVSSSVEATSPITSVVGNPVSEETGEETTTDGPRTDNESHDPSKTEVNDEDAVGSDATSVSSGTGTNTEITEGASASEGGAHEPTKSRKLRKLGNVVSTQTIECSECHKHFKTKANLKQHMKIHLKEANNVCSHCKRAFRNKSDLIRHIRIHTGETPYKCPKCIKTFIQVSHLRSHLITHDQPMGFKCEVCGKKFNFKVGMARHFYTHLSKKSPYVCQFCGKDCKQKSHLKEHIRTHTGEKPFHCSMCNQGFNSRGNLNKHLERYHRLDRDHSNKTGSMLQTASANGLLSGAASLSSSKTNGQYSSEPVSNSRDVLISPDQHERDNFKEIGRSDDSSKTKEIDLNDRIENFMEWRQLLDIDGDLEEDGLDDELHNVKFVNNQILFTQFNASSTEKSCNGKPGAERTSPTQRSLHQTTPPEQTQSSSTKAMYMLQEENNTLPDICSSVVAPVESIENRQKTVPPTVSEPSVSPKTTESSLSLTGSLLFQTDSVLDQSNFQSALTGSCTPPRLLAEESESWAQGEVDSSSTIVQEVTSMVGNVPNGSCSGAHASFLPPIQSLFTKSIQNVESNLSKPVHTGTQSDVTNEITTRHPHIWSDKCSPIHMTQRNRSPVMPTPANPTPSLEKLLQLLQPPNDIVSRTEQSAQMSRLTLQQSSQSKNPVQLPICGVDHPMYDTQSQMNVAQQPAQAVPNRNLTNSSQNPILSAMCRTNVFQDYTSQHQTHTIQQHSDNRLSSIVQQQSAKLHQNSVQQQSAHMTPKNVQQLSNQLPPDMPKQQPLHFERNVPKRSAQIQPDNLQQQSAKKQTHVVNQRSAHHQACVAQQQQLARYQINVAQHTINNTARGNESVRQNTKPDMVSHTLPARADAARKSVQIVNHIGNGPEHTAPRTTKMTEEHEDMEKKLLKVAQLRAELAQKLQAYEQQMAQSRDRLPQQQLNELPKHTTKDDINTPPDPKLVRQWQRMNYPTQVPMFSAEIAKQTVTPDFHCLQNQQQRLQKRQVTYEAPNVLHKKHHQKAVNEIHDRLSKNSNLFEDESSTDNVIVPLAGRVLPKGASTETAIRRSKTQGKHIENEYSTTRSPENMLMTNTQPSAKASTSLSKGMPHRETMPSKPASNVKQGGQIRTRNLELQNIGTKVEGKTKASTAGSMMAGQREPLTVSTSVHELQMEAYPKQTKTFSMHKETSHVLNEVCETKLSEQQHREERSLKQKTINAVPNETSFTANGSLTEQVEAPVMVQTEQSYLLNYTTVVQKDGSSVQDQDDVTLHLESSFTDKQLNGVHDTISAVQTEATVTVSPPKMLPLHIETSTVQNETSSVIQSVNFSVENNQRESSASDLEAFAKQSKEPTTMPEMVENFIKQEPYLEEQHPANERYARRFKNLTNHIQSQRPNQRGKRQSINAKRKQKMKKHKLNCSNRAYTLRHKYLNVHSKCAVRNIKLERLNELNDEGLTKQPRKATTLPSETIKELLRRKVVSNEDKEHQNDFNSKDTLNIMLKEEPFLEGNHLQQKKNKVQDDFIKQEIDIKPHINIIRSLPSETSIRGRGSCCNHPQGRYFQGYIKRTSKIKSGDSASSMTITSGKTTKCCSNQSPHSGKDSSHSKENIRCLRNPSCCFENASIANSRSSPSPSDNVPDLIDTQTHISECVHQQSQYMKKETHSRQNSARVQTTPSARSIQNSDEMNIPTESSEIDSVETFPPGYMKRSPCFDDPSQENVVLPLSNHQAGFTDVKQEPVQCYCSESSCSNTWLANCSCETAGCLKMEPEYDNLEHTFSPSNIKHSPNSSSSGSPFLSGCDSCSCLGSPSPNSSVASPCRSPCCSTRRCSSQCGSPSSTVFIKRSPRSSTSSPNDRQEDVSEPWQNLSSAVSHYRLLSPSQIKRSPCDSADCSPHQDSLDVFPMSPSKIKSEPLTYEDYNCTSPHSSRHFGGVAPSQKLISPGHIQSSPSSPLHFQDCRSAETPHSSKSGTRSNRTASGHFYQPSLCSLQRDQYVASGLSPYNNKYAPFPVSRSSNQIETSSYIPYIPNFNETASSFFNIGTELE